MAAIGKTRSSGVGNDERKMKGIKPSDLIIPGASVLILLVLTVFVYIPSITDASSMRDEIKTLKEKQETLQTNINALQPFVNDQTQLQLDLRKTKKIIPTKLDVADFSYYVDRLARENGLTFKEISAGNSSKKTDDEIITQNKNVDSFVSGVSGPIVYLGQYREIVEFLDALQRESPYIIEARNLEMKRAKLEDDEVASDAEWEVELSLMGYYIEKGSDVTIPQLYLPITPYTKYPQYLEVFEEKASILSTDELEEE